MINTLVRPRVEKTPLGRKTFQFEKFKYFELFKWNCSNSIRYVSVENFRLITFLIVAWQSKRNYCFTVFKVTYRAKRVDYHNDKTINHLLFILHYVIIQSREYALYILFAGTCIKYERYLNLFVFFLFFFFDKIVEISHDVTAR